MSRQSENKIRQGWRKVGPMCANCSIFSSELISKNLAVPVETHFHCANGGFPTGKRSWCWEHAWKEV